MNNKTVFTLPQNPDVQIWRYMDFTKFVSMLHNGGLHFSRCDQLGDHFEGFYPRRTVETIRSTREAIYGEVFGKLSIDKLEYLDRKSVEICRKYVMVNCWHINEHESAAMWKIYANSNEAVAIRSRYSTLRKCLDVSVDISVVDYIDDEESLSGFYGVPEQRIFIPFVHKRKYFSYEQELRAIFSPLSKEERINLAEKSNLKVTTISPEEGHLRQVNLNELIDAVVVAPTAPVWFKELVYQVSEKFSLNKIPIQSSLDKKP